MSTPRSESLWWPFSFRSTALLVGAAGTLGAGIFVYKALNAPLSSDGNAFEERFGSQMRKPGESATLPMKKEFKFARHAPQPDSVPVLILFGTEYGCSQEISMNLEKEIYQLGKYYPRVVNMEDHELLEWEKEHVVLIVTSTYGDGVPPTRARAFFDHFEANPKDLKHIKYSVLALGDSSYPYFCRAGKTLDALMEQYGAQRYHKRADIDLEDWDVIDRWCAASVSKLDELNLSPREDYLWEKVSNYQKKETFNRNRPFFAKLVVRKSLTQHLGKEDKETIHFEFDIDSSGIKYIVGDSLGILPTNCADEVNHLLKSLGCDGTQKVSVPSWKYDLPNAKSNASQASLREVLTYFYDLKNIKPKLMQLLLSEGGKQGKKDEVLKLSELLKGGTSTQNQALNDYFYGREVADVIAEYSAIKLKIPDILSTLGQLLPRYYSISSSLLQDPTKVTVTIAIVRYCSHNRNRKGVTSTYLADRVKVNDIVPIFVNNNPDFRLPDPSKPVLMIGPGTGIAPFRAMLQERILSYAPGSNTLYFGCRSYDKDFLYREELERLHSESKLTLHTAFSRESEKKFYVQHKLAENAADVWNFMESGGHLYICGDAQYMEKDVFRTLLEIIKNHGNKSDEEAAQYMHDLEKSKRYQKDTWF